MQPAFFSIAEEPTTWDGQEEKLQHLSLEEGTS
jgi:hypothetical protein